MKNTLFTNVALTKEDVWWEGLTEEPPDGLIDWRGDEWDKSMESPAAHPMLIYALSPMSNNSPEWENPEGVPVSAFIFGGRRMSDIPLCISP